MTPIPHTTGPEERSACCNARIIESTGVDLVSGKQTHPRYFYCDQCQKHCELPATRPDTGGGFTSNKRCTCEPIGNNCVRTDEHCYWHGLHSPFAKAAQEERGAGEGELKKAIDELLAKAHALPWYAVNVRLLYIQEIQRLQSQYFPLMVRNAFLAGLKSPPPR